MADVDWAILCDYSFLDVSRKMCLIGIFDRIFADNVPAVHQQAALAFKLVGDAHEQVQFRMELTRPEGRGVIAKIEGGGELADNGTAQLHVNINGLVLPDFGEYAFNVYIGDQPPKLVTFTVARRPQTAGPTR